MKQYGCIGRKLTHSFSKEIHAKLADYDYELIELTEEEMAAILAYAMENEFVASLLCAKSYQTYLGYYDWGTYKTYRMTFYSTLFRDRLSECGYEDDPARGFTLLGGKTGFTDEAKYCLASLSQGADGRRYIVVTAGGGDKYSSIADYMILLDLLHT